MTPNLTNCVVKTQLFEIKINIAKILKIIDFEYKLRVTSSINDCSGNFIRAMRENSIKEKIRFFFFSLNVLETNVH